MSNEFQATDIQSGMHGDVVIWTICKGKHISSPRGFEPPVSMLLYDAKAANSSTFLYRVHLCDLE